MAYNVSALAIRKPVPALVLFAVLLVLGLVSFRAIPITLAPNVDIPIVSVVVTEAGAAPGELETQVTRRVEDAVAGIIGVKHITSTVTDGSSSTVIELRLGTPVDRALEDVKDAVSRIQDQLPATIDPPVVSRVDVVGQAIQTYAASSPGMTPPELSWFVDDVVIRALQGLPGVGAVDRVGGVTREIRVALDPDRLAALGVTAGDVNRQVAATNVDLAGGRAELGGQEQAIRTLAGARSIAALAATRIMLPGGREARLSDLGTVTDSFQEPRVFARLDGDRPVVAFDIERAKGSSDVAVARVVADRLAQLAHAHPEVRFTRIDDAVHQSLGGFTAAMHALIEGAVLAVLVVFLFLRDWRATLVAAAALPLSIIPTFLAMHLMGFSYNFVSLLAITLVTGVLVDDAIVEIENIVRHMRMGKPAMRAAIDATDEIGLAVIAITLTIAAIFAPVSFMSGIAGQYFKQFGLTIGAAVLSSLLVARLLTPVMAARLLRHEAGADRAPHGAASRAPHGAASRAPHGVASRAPHDPHAATGGRAMRAYLGVLRATLARPYATLAIGLVLFVVSLWSTTLLPTDFIPAGDGARSVMSVELPPGSTLEDTRARTDRVATLFRRLPEVERVYVLGGRTPLGDDDVRRATLVMTLTPRSARVRTQKQLEGEFTRALATVPDIRGWYVNDRGGRQLEVGMLGNDADALYAASSRLESAMRTLPGFSNVAASAGLDRPEIAVVPRGDEAAKLGVSPQAIADAVRIATLGDVDAALPRYRDEDRQIPIRVEVARRLRADLGALGALPVEGAGGVAVPLEAVADLRHSEGPSSIDRYDRERRVELAADLAPGMALGDAIGRVFALPAAHGLPAGVRLENGGDAEIMGEVFAGFVTAMGTGLMLVLAVLVLLFGGVFQPVTILLSLPFSLGGVIGALQLTHEPISMPVVIGLLMLIGIVAKNAIMLVDFAVRSRAAGMARRDALEAAGRMRARPIVMTSIAMIAGMLPSAFGVGDGGEFRAPMAIGVIGGLTASTVLSLVFVPAFYLVMDDAEARTARLLRGVGRLGRRRAPSGGIGGALPARSPPVR